MRVNTLILVGLLLACMVLVLPVSAAVLVKYPDEDTLISREVTSNSFSDIHNGAGTVITTDGDNGAPSVVAHASVSGNFTTIRELAFTFNTTLPAGATLTGAVMRVRGANKGNGLGSYSLCLINSSHSTPMVQEDYNRFGNTVLANNISYASWAVEDNNNFTLNAAGLAWINKTGTTKLMLVSDWFLNNSFGGTWAGGLNTNINGYLSEQPGTDADPYLELTYTESAAIPTASFTQNVTLGNAPLSVGFTDTSATTPTAWNWSYNATNMLGHSQDFNIAYDDYVSYWTTWVAEVVPATVPAPDGSMTAWKLVDNSTDMGSCAGNDHNVGGGTETLFQPNTNYTFSVYLKPAGDPWAMLSVHGMNDVFRNGYFDITNGAVGGVSYGGAINTSGDVNLTITPAGNGWYRCIMRFNSNTGTVSPFPEVFIFSAKGDTGWGDCGGGSFVGDGVSGINMWGAQLERGDFATPYIKTTTQVPKITYMGITQNQAYSFPTGGNFTIKLSVTNASGTNVSTQTAWANVSPAIRTYPVNTINETQIKPNSDTNLPSTGSDIYNNQTPGQYGATSFVVKATSELYDLNITAGSLIDITNASNTVPASATSIKIAKAWWQAATTTYYTAIGYYLTPELLLNDDNLVNVNLSAQKNRMRIKNATFDGYILIDNTSAGQFPSDPFVYDNTTAAGFPKLFTVNTNQNKQVWLTTLIPTTTLAGNYTQNVTISSSTSTPVNVTLHIRVLPFTLSTPTKEQAMYYRGLLNTTVPINITSEQKTSAQYSLELADMKAHGISYPSSYDATQFMNTAMGLRSASGLPKDHIYLSSNSMIPWPYGISTTQSELDTVASTLATIQGYATTNGFGDIYAAGWDEPTAGQVAQMNGSLSTVLTNGSKTYFSSYEGSGQAVAVASNTTMIDLTALDETDAALYRAVNPAIKLFTYNNPQMGVEDPEVYRENYGFRLWASTYDGAMLYAYQDAYPNKSVGYTIWNDFDGNTVNAFRDHVAAYPITNGVVNTIQQEGYREGVDDTRYADYLSNITGNRTEATTIINAGIAAGSDMSVIRGTLIDHILAYGDTVHPVASFTTNTTSGVVPLAVAFNDTSTGSPTTWNWSFGDGNWANGTAQNVTHIYEFTGTFSAFLIASNSAGTNQSASQNITVGVIPTADFTAAASGTTVAFTDLSTGTAPLSYIWQYNQHEAPAWVQFSTSQNPSYDFVPGTYDINLTATNAAGSDSEVKGSFIIVSEGEVPIVFPDEPSGYDEAKARYASDNEGMITAMILIFLVAAIVGVAIGIKCLREGITTATFPLIVGYFIGVFILVIVFAAIPAFAYIGEV